MNSRFGINIVCILVLTFVISACAPTPTMVPATTPIILTPFNTLTPSPSPVAADRSSTQPIPTPTATLQIYKVKKDELGSSIALRYGITLQMLQSSNPGVDLNFLKEGQHLVIPPKQLSPAPNLSSPTPAALQVKDIDCFPAADGAGNCIAVVYNDQPSGAMYVTGEFILNGNGKTWQRTFTSMLNTLPAGRQIPVYARFDAPFPFPYQVSVTIHTALLQSLDAQNSAVPQIVDPVIVIDPDGLAAKVTGNISINASTPKGLAIVAAGYTGEQPAGVRRIEVSSSLNAGQTLPFTIWLYSFGPRMDKVDLFVEAQ